MDAEEWKKNVLEAVKQISDRSYQEKTWFGMGDAVSSPEELFCGLFDDHMYDDFLEASEVNMTQTQRDLGTQLKEKLNIYSENTDEFLDPRQVLNDPEWDEIRMAAKKFLESFQAK